MARINSIQSSLDLKQNLSDKDGTGGYVGLTLFKINFKNVANTITSFFTNSNTVARTYTFQDRDGTVALTSDISKTAINAQTGTTYTFVLEDGINTLCTFANAGAITVTVPPNSSVAFPIGTKIDCIQDGAGKVTFALGAGVTINSQASNKSIAAQYVGVSLIKEATDVWYLVGSLIA